MAKQKQTKADGCTTINEIPPKYQRALSMLITGSTVTEAAEAVGLHRQQLSRAINQNAHIKAAYMQLKADAAAQIVDGMRAIVEKAIKIIAATLDDEDVPQDVKFNAAMSIAGADIVKAAQPKTARDIVTEAEQAEMTDMFINNMRPSEDCINATLAADWRALEAGETDAA